MDHIVTLDTLGAGAAMERFDIELNKVLENIADPNTKPDSVREVRMVIKIKPSKDRKTGAMQLATTSKLAPYEAVESNVWFGKKDGEIRMVEHNPLQLGLDIKPVGTEEGVNQK